MLELTRLRGALVIVAIGAALTALGEALNTAANAVITQSSYSTAHALGAAGDWVTFAGAVLFVGAVAAVGWRAVLQRRHVHAAEIGAVTLGALLVAIGTLVQAASDSAGNTANILVALGNGVWAVLLVVIAARSSMAEQQTRPGEGRDSGYWLMAAGAFVVLAVRSGLPSPEVGHGTPGVVAGALGILGFTVLALVLWSLRAKRVFTSPSLRLAIIGIGVFVVQQVALIVFSAVVNSSNATLTQFRVTGSIAFFVAMLAWLWLAAAAWQRAAEVPATALEYLTNRTASTEPLEPPVAPSEEREATPQPHGMFCSHCGGRANTDDVYCVRCGTRLRAPGS